MPTQLRLLPRCDGARNRGGGAVMANREARQPLFCLMGQVGVGEAVNPSEERGAGRRHAHNVETERGAVCSRSVARNRALRSDMVKVAEMR